MRIGFRSSVTLCVCVLERGVDGSPPLPPLTAAWLKSVKAHNSRECSSSKHKCFKFVSTVARATTCTFARTSKRVGSHSRYFGYKCSMVTFYSLMLFYSIFTFFIDCEAEYRFTAMQVSVFTFLKERAYSTYI